MTDTPSNSPELATAIAEQQALLKAILSDQRDAQSAHHFKAHQLAPYRRGLKANAARALEVTFPTVHTLIGTQNFETLAAAYLQYDPPTTGDWGLWGAQLSNFLPTIEALSDYPFLGACAQLDWICHLAEREADRHLQADSLALLEQAPENIYFIPGIGMKLIHSPFPIVDIYNAHHDSTTTTDWMALAREKLSAGEGQTALVWRRHWKAHVQACDETLTQWFKQLENQHNLGQCLDTMDNTDFAFETWLPLAIEQGWVLGITQKPGIA